MQVQHFIIEGCRGTAVEASSPDSTNTSTSGGSATTSGISTDLNSTANFGVKLTDLRFTGHTATSAAALRVGSGVALRLRNCTFERNTAGSSVVLAETGSELKVINCIFAANNGTALVFKGRALSIEGSRFEGNRANGSYASGINTTHAAGSDCTHLPVAAQSSSGRSGPFIFSNAELESLEGRGRSEAVNAGALRILCPSDMQAVCNTTVSNTVFVDNNSGAAGGACFVGSRVNARIQRCSFSANAAGWLGGSAVFAFRDSCLQLTDSVFNGNGQSCNRLVLFCWRLVGGVGRRLFVMCLQTGLKAVTLWHPNQTVCVATCLFTNAGRALALLVVLRITTVAPSSCTTRPAILCGRATRLPTILQPTREARFMSVT